MVEKIKTSFLLPKDIYLELKKRVVRESGSVKDILIYVIIEYLFKIKSKNSRKKLIELIITPCPEASPEDYREYEYEDLGE